MKSNKNTKFFLNLANNRQEKSLIKHLKIDNDENITDEKTILNEIEGFYKELYTEKNNADGQNWINEILEEGNIPQLSDTQKEKLSLPLTKQELEKIIKTSEKNKSPGSDGLPIEFYIVFWQKISNLLMEAINEGIEAGELSNSQKQTLIRLIGKKDKDKAQLKNWRPLNLINSDTKMYTKTLATRMIDVMPDLINSDQCAYVKGRFIGEGIKTIEGVISYINEKKTNRVYFGYRF